MKKHKKECAFCGETFYSQRKDAKTCSNTCRVYLFKLNSGFYDNDKRFEISDNNVSNVNVNISETLRRDIEYVKLKHFLLNHEKEIHGLSIDLDLRTEDEYAEIAVIASKASRLLYTIRNNNELEEKFLEQINTIERLYEQHLKEQIWKKTQ